MTLSHLTRREHTPCNVLLPFLCSARKTWIITQLRACEEAGLWVLAFAQWLLSPAVQTVEFVSVLSELLWEGSRFCFSLPIRESLLCGRTNFWQGAQTTALKVHDERSERSIQSRRMKWISWDTPAADWKGHERRRKRRDLQNKSVIKRWGRNSQREEALTSTSVPECGWNPARPGCGRSCLSLETLYSEHIRCWFWRNCAVQLQEWRNAIPFSGARRSLIIL